MKLKIIHIVSEESTVNSDHSILKYNNQPSITAIQNKLQDRDSFNFIEVGQKQINKEILKLVKIKASQGSDISKKALKENIDIFSNFLCNNFNNSIKLSSFLDILKHAGLTTLYRKGKKDIKGNCRPVSTFPNLSKIFEKSMFEQISIFFENIFSKYQCGKCPEIPRNAFWQC